VSSCSPLSEEHKALKPRDLKGEQTEHRKEAGGAMEGVRPSTTNPGTSGRNGGNAETPESTNQPTPTYLPDLTGSPGPKPSGRLGNLAGRLESPRPNQAPLELRAGEQSRVGHA
jgi:hypothetical protein